MSQNNLQNKKVKYVEVKGITWQKDSHGLFDYECKNLNIVKFRIDADSRIGREGSIFFHSRRSTEISPTSKPRTPRIRKTAFNHKINGWKVRISL